eukprot:scaffold285_cov330-Pavlova_lutheri.AAC.126
MFSGVHSASAISWEDKAATVFMCAKLITRCLGFSESLAGAQDNLLLLHGFQELHPCRQLCDAPFELGSSLLLPFPVALLGLLVLFVLLGRLPCFLSSHEFLFLLGRIRTPVRSGISPVLLGRGGRVHEVRERVSVVRVPWVHGRHTRSRIPGQVLSLHLHLNQTFVAQSREVVVEERVHRKLLSEGGRIRIQPTVRRLHRPFQRFLRLPGCASHLLHA